MIPRALFAAALSLLAWAAPAQEAQFLPAEDHPAWTAIGRLNVIGHASRKMCTATLIAPDRVLTAAHCMLYDNGDPIPLDKLRFVPGWFRGDYAGVGMVGAVMGIEPFQRALKNGKLSVSTDTAILTLIDPIADVPPLTTAPPKWVGKVRILGYRWDRPHALSDTGLCTYKPRSGGGLIMTCPATFGNSGGPILQRQDGEWRVVGVVSAISPGRTHGAPLP